MNQLLAEEMVRAAVNVRLEKSQAQAMIRTGRWANTLVANATQHWRGVLLGHALTSHVGHVHLPTTPAQHVFGLPKVVQELPLRGLKRPPDLGPLYDSDSCLGSLVDVWTTINKVPGHLKVGPAVAAIIDRFLDQNTDV